MDKFSECRKWVSVWLSRCNHFPEHLACRRSRSDDILPTRLLHIIGPDEVRLVVTDCIPKNSLEDTPYVCLSHRWGLPQPLMTTKENFHVFTKNIPWDSIPLTFQDVIKFTFELGLKYLWIDSLCIVQNDVQDWQREGSQMAQIYENAFLTISVSHSENSATGILQSVPAGLAPYTCNIPDAATCFDRSSTTLHIKPWHSHLHTDFTCSDVLPLFDRGWVYQEWLLSSRVVHFCASEVVWICQANTTCQCGRRIGRYEDTFFRGIPQGIHGNAFHPVELWQRLVSEYSERQLTFESDIFPALQGIAKMFHRTKLGMRPVYVAGMWTTSLNHDLLWNRQKPSLGNNGQRTTTNTRQWRAPSWSWASVNGGVRWPTKDKSMTWTEIARSEAWTVSVGDDNFGQLEGGELTIEGPCISGTLSGRYVYRSEFGIYLPEIRFAPDSCWLSTTWEDKVIVVIDNDRLSHGLCVLTSAIRPQVCVMLVAKATRGRSFRQKLVEFHYIIFRKASGRKFERVGRLDRKASLDKDYGYKFAGVDETTEDPLWKMAIRAEDVVDWSGYFDTLEDSANVIEHMRSRTEEQAMTDFGQHRTLKLTVV